MNTWRLVAAFMSRVRMRISRGPGVDSHSLMVDLQPGRASKQHNVFVDVLRVLDGGMRVNGRGLTSLDGGPTFSRWGEQCIASCIC